MTARKMGMKLTWRVVGCDVEVQVVPGNHYSMLEREHIEDLVPRVRALLASGPSAWARAETPAPA